MKYTPVKKGTAGAGAFVPKKMKGKKTKYIVKK